MIFAILIILLLVLLLFKKQLNNFQLINGIIIIACCLFFEQKNKESLDIDNLPYLPHYKCNGDCKIFDITDLLKDAEVNESEYDLLKSRLKKKKINENIIPTTILIYGKVRNAIFQEKKKYPFDKLTNDKNNLVTIEAPQGTPGDLTKITTKDGTNGDIDKIDTQIFYNSESVFKKSQQNKITIIIDDLYTKIDYTEVKKFPNNWLFVAHNSRDNYNQSKISETNKDYINDKEIIDNFNKDDINIINNKFYIASFIKEHETINTIVKNEINKHTFKYQVKIQEKPYGAAAKRRDSGLVCPNQNIYHPHIYKHCQYQPPYNNEGIFYWNYEVGGCRNLWGNMASCLTSKSNLSKSRIKGEQLLKNMIGNNTKIHEKDEFYFDTDKKEKSDIINESIKSDIDADITNKIHQAILYENYGNLTRYTGYQGDDGHWRNAHIHNYPIKGLYYWIRKRRAHNQHLLSPQYKHNNLHYNGYGMVWMFKRGHYVVPYHKIEKQPTVSMLQLYDFDDHNYNTKTSIYDIKNIITRQKNIEKSIKDMLTNKLQIDNNLAEKYCENIIFEKKNNEFLKSLINDDSKNILTNEKINEKIKNILLDSENQSIETIYISKYDVNNINQERIYILLKNLPDELFLQSSS